MAENEWVRRSAAERLESDLMTIESRFTTQLPETSRVASKKISVVPIAAGGLFGGLFLMVLGTLFSKRYKAYRGAKALGLN